MTTHPFYDVLSTPVTQLMDSNTLSRSVQSLLENKAFQRLYIHMVESADKHEIWDLWLDDTLEEFLKDHIGE